MDTLPQPSPRPDREDERRRKLIDATIATMAEVGFPATTLALIGQRAGMSAGLVAHYFNDKDGLLEATLRSLGAALAAATARRFAQSSTPRARVQAIIDSYLAPEEFERRTSTVWLAFWGVALHSPRLKRVQHVYQQRTQSNLRHALKQLVPADRVNGLATTIAALIDGLWLRATLSAASANDSADARAMVTTFVDMEIAAAGPPRFPPHPTAGETPRQRSFIGGAYRANADGRSFKTLNPADGRALAEIEIAGSAEVDAAVACSREAQPGWAKLPGMERARILQRVASLLRARNAELAELETRDTGKPIQETIAVDVISAAENFEYFAGLAASITGDHVDLGDTAFGYVRREPLGVVAGVGAWNYPIQIASWKAAPALACGNAMVFKPAELTPLTALKLAEIMTEAGVPAGVFNVVQGMAETGRLLSRHPDIRKISLTGGVATGKAAMRDGADTLKHVTLELGGKSPLIVFEDADLDEAVSGAMLGNFYSAGEVCSNCTRVFVHASIRERFLERLMARTRALRIGHPLDPSTQVGALISEAHMERVLGYIASGQAEGAALLCGGQRVTDRGLGRGYFISPAIFDGCHDGMRIVREEIFGPIMSVLSFTDEAEVVARANATEFGLSAGLFTRDLARAHRVIARLEAGTCWINHYNISPLGMPFGGVKQSGIGRENSKAAIEHYTQLKSVYVNLGAVDAPY